ncbi:MAG: hypothetical protein F4X66_19340 [Chloroflexi bacterium]|nr:hypothetical protein [Chloroflexota bacterium]MYE40494.1 hypothetical protein [Chloroflexota bacterium]
MPDGWSRGRASRECGDRPDYDGTTDVSPQAVRGAGPIRQADARLVAEAPGAFGTEPILTMGGNGAYRAPRVFGAGP